MENDPRFIQAQKKRYYYSLEDSIDAAINEIAENRLAKNKKVKIKMFNNF